MFELNTHGLSREQYEARYKRIVDTAKVQYLTDNMNFRFGYTNGFSSGYEQAVEDLATASNPKQANLVAHLQDENAELREIIERLRSMHEQQQADSSPQAQAVAAIDTDTVGSESHDESEQAVNTAVALESQTEVAQTPPTDEAPTLKPPRSRKKKVNTNDNDN